jgi:hypothetical protein
MYFIHHVAVTSENVHLFRQVLAEYRDNHPWIIIRHGPGFMGKNYQVQATKDISEVFREAGIPCWVSGHDRT